MCTSTVALADHLMSSRLRANIDLVVVWVNGFWGSDEAACFAKALWAAFDPTRSPRRGMSFADFYQVWQHSRQSAEPVCLVIDKRVGCQPLTWCRVAEEVREEEVEDDVQRVVLEGQDEVKSNE